MQDDPQFQAYLADHRIVWRHQTPQSPWMGGHYERLVRIIKVCLSTAIARKIFTYKEFVTLVKEAETIISSWPITYQNADTADIPLTPSQLAWGSDLMLMPPLLQSDSYSEVNLEAKAAHQQYKILSQALDRFQRRWSTEYLSTLREKQNNCCAERPTHHINPGNLVMVRQDDRHRIECRLGCSSLHNH